MSRGSVNENNRAPGDAALAAYYRGLQAAVSLNDGRPHVEPYQAILSLTMRCNSRCAYCESWHSREEGPELAELEAVLANLIELGVRELVLTGGEPLLKRDLLPFLQSAHRLGMFQVLITNGLLLTALPMTQSGEGRVSSAAGFLDFSNYMGAGIGGIVSGVVADRWGWGVAFGFWVAAATLGMLVMAALWCSRRVPQGD